MNLAEPSESEPLKSKVPRSSLGTNRGFRIRRLALKELRETLRDRRTIVTLILMPLLVYPILSLVFRTFLATNAGLLGGDKPIVLHIAYTGAQPEAEQLLSSINHSLQFEQAIEREKSDGNQTDDPINEPTDDPTEPETNSVDSKSSALNRPTIAETDGATGILGIGKNRSPFVDFDQHRWVFVPPEKLESAVKLGEADVGVRFETKKPKSWPLGRAILFSRNDNLSRAAADYLNQHLSQFNQATRVQFLRRARLPTDEAISIDEQAVDSPDTGADGFSLASLIPLVLVLMTITGAVYPAIDLTAGEKERGTLETLMAAPIPRIEILIAKFSAVWTVAVLTALLNMIGMAATVWAFRLDQFLSGTSEFTLLVVLKIFLLLVLFAAFFSALLLAVTSFARSFKEAQAYLIPIILLAMGPGLLAMTPGLTLTGAWVVMPMVNILLLARDVIQNQAQLMPAVIAILSTTFYAAFAIVLAARSFGSDAILYSSHGSFSEMFSRPAKPRSLVPFTATTLCLALLFPINFVLIGLLSRLPAETAADMSNRFLMMAGFTILSFMVFPWLIAVHQRTRVSTGFGFQRTRWVYFAIAALLGISLWPIVISLLEGFHELYGLFVGAEQRDLWKTRLVEMTAEQVQHVRSVPPLIVALCLSIAPAIGEEWFFRGMLLRTLIGQEPSPSNSASKPEPAFNMKKVWTAILLSAIVFGLFHVLTDSVIALNRLLPTTLVGLVLGYLAFKSNSILPGMVLHAIHNGAIVFLAYYQPQLSQYDWFPGETESLPIQWVVGAVLIAVIGLLWLFKAKRVIASTSSTATTGLIMLATLALASNASAQSVPAQLSQTIQKIGVTIPAGFSIERVADDSLATNLFCLTTGPRGDVFVSGPGFIKQLIDDDRDGHFESAKTFASTPASGAQGLWCGDDRLLAVGDGGVWQYWDRNHDGLADGPPTRLMDIKTGGEHLAHAIRKGPDGWWYLIAGNQTPIKDEYFSGPNSPVKHPRAGFIMRMSPDFKTQEIVAHGFRNAYDFAFDSADQIYTYDSDGERDISLPWYRPTRVFQIQPGDDAGWVSAGWKRPSEYFDMPIQLGEAGRGSPTGVEVYTGHAFPVKYESAILVGDWTFGRIIVFKKDPHTGHYDQGNEFAIADGQFGFAVTDLAVAADGSLLVCVGGRGTAGGVYRISHDNSPPRATKPQRDANIGKLRNLARNRAAWDREQTLRVLEALTSGTEDSLALEMMIGRSRATAADQQYEKLLIKKLAEVVLPFDWVPGDRLRPGYRVVSELEPRTIAKIDRANIMTLGDLVLDLAGSDSEATRIKLLANVTEQLRNEPLEKKRRAEIARIGQLAVGGAGGNGPQMFRGYTAVRSVSDLQTTNPEIADALADALAAAIADDDNFGASEVARLAAMLNVQSPKLQITLANQLTIQPPTPVQNIHWLNCLAQAKSIESDTVAQKIATALVRIDDQVLAAGLKTDKNWVPRMNELTQRLFQLSPPLASTVVDGISGRDGQIFLFDALPDDLRDAASEKFFNAINDNLNHATVGQLRVATTTQNEASLELLRKAAEFRHLQDAAIVRLAAAPQAADRHWFEIGLKSRDANVLNRSARALIECQPADRDPELVETELASNRQVSLNAFAAARRLGWNKLDSPIRDTLIELLQSETGRSLGYQLRKPALNQQAVVNQWQEFLTAKFPDAVESLVASDRPSEVLKQLADVNWTDGDSQKGATLYQSLKCQQCHDGGSRLGPRLEGVTKRFSRDDLFRSIIVPANQIPDRYRATILETVDGNLFRGTVIYESVDGVTLQDSNGSTIRINQAEIESQTQSNQSLMPEGLLDGIELDQWADLYEYLQTL